MDAPPSGDLLLKSLRKIVAALQGVGHPPVAIGDLAQKAWGSKRAPRGVHLLVASGEAHRGAILSAARGEGLQQEPGPSPLALKYTDAKLGASAGIDIIEAATPFQKQVVGRAQPADVLQVYMPLATVDDVILLGVASGDREAVVELLRANAGRIDAGYLKKEAEAAGTFDQLKSAWQEARK
jgi:hypothetical protein